MNQTETLSQFKTYAKPIDQTLTPRTCISVPMTQFKEFERLWAQGLYKGLRYGQAFYNYMNFHKTVDQEVEKLYNCDFQTAWAWIQARLDWDN